MSESAILNIARGNRLSMYMGLQMDNGVTFKYAQDYSYVEIPVRDMYNPSSEEVVTKALRNQHLRINPACSLNIRGHYKVLVKVNPLLQEVSSCPTMFLLDVGLGEQPIFYASFRRDFDIRDLTWAVRLYMLA